MNLNADAIPFVPSSSFSLITSPIIVCNHTFNEKTVIKNKNKSNLQRQGQQITTENLILDQSDSTRPQNRKKNKIKTSSSKVNRDDNKGDVSRQKQQGRLKLNTQNSYKEQKRQIDVNPVRYGTATDTTTVPIISSFIDEFPKLLSSQPSSSVLKEAIHHHSNLDSHSTYLSLASKKLKETNIDYSREKEIIKGDASWYYSNSKQDGLSVSLVPKASVSLLKDSKGIEDEEKEYSELSSHNVHTATTATHNTISTSSADDTAVKLLQTVCIAPLLSGSKSTAEKWKLKWLEIARLKAKSNIEVNRHEQLLAKAKTNINEFNESNDGKTQKQWHSVLSHVLKNEESASNLYVYSQQQFLHEPLPQFAAKTSVPIFSEKKDGHKILNLKSKAAAVFDVELKNVLFQWWTAVLSGNKTIILQLLSSNRITCEICFNYSAYIAESQAIMNHRDTFGVNDSIVNIAASVPMNCTSSLLQAFYNDEHTTTITTTDQSYFFSEMDDGFNAFHICAKLAHAEILEQLLRITSAYVDSKDRIHKQTPLMLACEFCSLECAKILLSHGADCECKDKFGETALHKITGSSSSSLANQIALLSFLCDKSRSTGTLKINTKNKKRETALMFCKTREMAIILISGGADVMCVNSDGIDVACIAARRGDSKLLDAILSCNSFRLSSQREIGKTNQNNNATVKVKISSSLNNVSTTPLHEAAIVGSLSCVRLLLSNRHKTSSIDMNALCFPRRATPLMLACTAGHTKVVEELLIRGANVDIEDQRTVTALVLAARYGNVSCVKSITNMRPLSVFHLNSNRETILEMISRIIRLDSLNAVENVTENDNSSSSSSSEKLGRNIIEQCIPSMVELVLYGAVITERFIKRISSNQNNSKMKSMKMLLVDKLLGVGRGGLLQKDRNGKDSVLVNNNYNNNSNSNMGAIMTYQIDATDSMYHISIPNIDCCDVTFLLAEGESLLAHIFIISNSSAVLRAMLQSDMLQSSKKKSRRREEDNEKKKNMTFISFPDHSKVSFVLLLDWMYTRKNVTDTLETNHVVLFDLLFLSNELLILPLQRLCEQRIAKYLVQFDKNTILALCENLQLQLLQTYCIKEYTLLPIDPLLLSKHSIIDIFNFVQTANDSEWYTWLCDVSSISNRSDNINTVYSIKDYNEDHIHSWWLKIMICLTLDSQGVKEKYRVAEIVATAQIHLFKYSRPSTDSNCDDEVLARLQRKDSMAPLDFTSHRCVTSIPTPNPAPSLLAPPLISGSSSSTFEMNWIRIFSNLNRRIVSVNLSTIHSHLPSQSSYMDSNEGEHNIASDLDIYLNGLLRIEPFLALNPTSSSIFSRQQQVIVDNPFSRNKDKEKEHPQDSFLSRSYKSGVFEKRLNEITPPIIQLHQQRIALLYQPDTSTFDVLLVIVISMPNKNSNNCNSNSESDYFETWNTFDNNKYIPYTHLKGLHKDMDRVVCIPAHKAIISAGSDRMKGMMRFVDGQSNTNDEDVSVLRIDVGDGEAANDFKNLVWYMYSGLLRDNHFEKKKKRTNKIESELQDENGDEKDVKNSSKEGDTIAAQLLRMLYLSDEYLMPNLTSLLEYRLLEVLSPRNACDFFMAAHTLELPSLRLAAALCALYAVEHHVKGYRIEGQHVETYNKEQEEENDIDSTRLILLKMLHVLVKQ